MILSGGISSNKSYPKPQDRNECTLSNAGEVALKMRTEVSDVAERKDARKRGDIHKDSHYKCTEKY